MLTRTKDGSGGGTDARAKGEKNTGSECPAFPKNEFWEEKRERRRERERVKKNGSVHIGICFSQFDPISLELRQTKSFNAIELRAHF